MARVIFNQRPKGGRYDPHILPPMNLFLGHTNDQGYTIQVNGTFWGFDQHGKRIKYVSLAVYSPCGTMIIPAYARGRGYCVCQDLQKQIMYL